MSDTEHNLRISNKEGDEINNQQRIDRTRWFNCRPVSVIQLPFSRRFIREKILLKYQKTYQNSHVMLLF